MNAQVILSQPNRAEPWVIRLTRRFSIHYFFLTLIPAVLILIPGLILFWLEIPPDRGNPRGLLTRLLIPPLIITYSLAMMRYLYDATKSMLVRLRPALLIDDQEYHRLTNTMLTVDRRVEIVILLIGIVTAIATVAYNLTTFFGARVLAERHPILSYIIISAEVLMGVLVALFVYTGFERGIALFRLFRRPLAIDPFDHTNLSPLNSLSLRVTLGLIGLVTIPIVVTGRFLLFDPVQLVVFIGATLSAIVAFLLPLWGAHQQMSQVREQELQTNAAKLKALYRELHDRVDRKVDGRDVADEVNALVQYQRLLDSAPTWPYQGARIGIQLSAPIALPLLVYILQELLGPLIGQVTQ